jgi:hypothetical protein
LVTLLKATGVALKVGRKKWALLALFIGLALFGQVLYKTLYIDYGERALVVAALIDQGDMKRQIEAELLQGKPALTLLSVQRMPSHATPVDNNGTIVIPSYTRLVDTSGTIVMYLAEISTTVVLTPSVNGNEVRWSCSGDVPRNLVSECRQPMPDSILPLVKRAKSADQSSR